MRTRLATTPLLSAFALFVALSSGVAAQGLGLPIGTQLPEFTLHTLDGKEVAIGEVVPPGKPALVEIWASWCEICEALQPQLDEIAGTWGDEVNVVAIAVSVAQSERRVRRHVEDAGHPYTYLWDGDGAGVRALNAATTGIVMIFDADGRVVYAGSGRNQDLVGEIRKVLGKG
ncbi:MAG: TlpA disulfide reductase family protein [Longimicrobiales bacterium]|nr:TlpA disulfide reductase family protein [Longimicrobiales bacterium]